MDKIEELLKKLHGDPERCAEIADELEKELKRLHFQYCVRVDYLKQVIGTCHTEADQVLDMLPDEQTDAIHYASNIYELTDKTLAEIEREELLDENVGLKKLQKRLDDQAEVLEKFLGYASVTLAAGFFNADHMRKLMHEAEEVLRDGCD